MTQPGLTGRAVQSPTIKSGPRKAGRPLPMVPAVLRSHGLALALVLKALVVGLVVGGILCATLICR